MLSVKVSARESDIYLVPLSVCLSVVAPLVCLSVRMCFFISGAHQCLRVSQLSLPMLIVSHRTSCLVKSARIVVDATFVRLFVFKRLYCAVAHCWSVEALCAFLPR